ncbi:MAG: hypothetical protein MJZ92_02650 [Paludibacteraceae bacterium]|nr:hypothetical protein [Paludibacteraceae bacterium]
MEKNLPIVKLLIDAIVRRYIQHITIMFFCLCLSLHGQATTKGLVTPMSSTSQMVRQPLFGSLSSESRYVYIPMISAAPMLDEDDSWDLPDSWEDPGEMEEEEDDPWDLPEEWQNPYESEDTPIGDGLLVLVLLSILYLFKKKEKAV